MTQNELTSIFCIICKKEYPVGQACWLPNICTYCMGSHAPGTLPARNLLDITIEAEIIRDEILEMRKPNLEKIAERAERITQLVYELTEPVLGIDQETMARFLSRFEDDPTPEDTIPEVNEPVWNVRTMSNWDRLKRNSVPFYMDDRKQHD